MSGERVGSIYVNSTIRLFLSAWEDIVINQSMGRIQYYTEEDL